MEFFHNVGKVFHSRGHCADALANFIVYGKTEEEVEKRIYLCDEWFSKQNVYSDI